METNETPAERPFDSLTFIMAFEQDDIGLIELVEGFAGLIQNGKAWTLQGVYGRTAHALIERGFISRGGAINWDAVTAAEDSL